MTLPTLDIAFMLKAEPKELVDYFQSKGLVTSWTWQDLWQQAHVKSFTVAKAARLDILQDIRDGVTKAIAEGQTFKAFERDLAPILKEKGWWGKVMVGDGAGGAEVVQLGSTRRLQTIYSTNLQNVYQSGRWKSFLANKAARPILVYFAVLDSRTRPTHRQLMGLMAPVDSPIWGYIAPPNGFGCRCWLRSMTVDEANGMAAEMGFQWADSERMTVEQQVMMTGEARDVAVYQGTDSAGQKFTFKTDPGWAYNPGREAWQPELDKYDYDIAYGYLKGGLNSPDFDAFFAQAEGFGGRYPVAVLDEEYRAAIGATQQTVWLSDETLAKQLRNHPDLSIDDYRKLPDLIGSAETIVQDGENTLVFIRQDGKIYQAALKATASGERIYLTSFRLTNEADVERVKKKGTVLRDGTT